MRLIKSFIYAFRGIWICIREERNFRIHTVAIITVLIFSILYGLPFEQYPALILILAIVPALEAVNTSIERAVDLESESPHPLARDAKDTASGAVLISAVASIVMACFLFSDISKLRSVLLIFTKPLPLTALVLYIVLSAIYVFVPKHK
ncbi:MAG: diacylglycerol kinase family protein [Clostridia bacterium]|nr:diacylglycerol kinase family protein [Clostridia bacterium]